MFEFRMPKLGADMEEGILLEWKIAPGDTVNKGDIVAVVETSKGAIDIEVFENGVVDSLLIQPNEVVQVGTVMAHLHVKDERESGWGFQPQLSTDSKTQTKTPISRSRPTSIQQSPASATSVKTESKLRLEAPATGVRVSPRARRLAQQSQVDLATVTGTGPHGSVVAEDIAAAAKTQSAKSTSTKQPKNLAMRTAIAAAMSRSKREIPHYYLSHDVDVLGLILFVESWNEGHGIADRILPALLYYKAVAIAAQEFESMSGFYSDNSFQPAATVNLGIAISLRGGGLMAPCVMDVPNKRAIDLMRELKDLVARTRSGGLRASEMSEGTLTVSNLGDRGVDFLAGVIYPPQVALVGIGSVCNRPWVVEDKIEIRPIINLSLAADHRVSDGHTGALFLRRIAELIANPEGLM